jgi:hypothetical protein
VVSQFTIVENKWFGWQMMPGYVGTGFLPYCSPIFVSEVKALKTGKGIIQLKFLNAFYAVGVQDFSITMKVMKRDTNYLVGDLMDSINKSSDRCAVISQIEFEWIKEFCPTFYHHQPPSSEHENASVEDYLNKAFLRKRS